MSMHDVDHARLHVQGVSEYLGGGRVRYFSALAGLGRNIISPCLFMVQRE
jgi:hypothetical protein